MTEFSYMIPFHVFHGSWFLLVFVSRYRFPGLNPFGAEVCPRELTSNVQQLCLERRGEDSPTRGNVDGTLTVWPCRLWVIRGGLPNESTLKPCDDAYDLSVWQKLSEPANIEADKYKPLQVSTKIGSKTKTTEKLSSVKDQKHWLQPGHGRSFLYLPWRELLFVLFAPLLEELSAGVLKEDMAKGEDARELDLSEVMV